MTLPYYPRYTKNFLEATAGWPLELKGAYGVLLDLIYHHGGELPDDPHFIAGNLGCSVRKWNLIRDDLLGKSKIISRLSRDNIKIITNKRADKEAEKLKRYEEKQRQNGSKAHDNKDIGDATADAKPDAMGDAKDNPPHQPVRATLDLDSDSDKKEEEDARGADIRFAECELPPPKAALFADIRQAVGIPSHEVGPYWADAALTAHVTAWRSFGLTDDQILAEAKASRAKNPEAPDGPKALDRWMESAARAKRNAPAPGQTKAAPKAEVKPPPTPEERLKFFANWVNGDTALPPSTINNTLALSLLEAGLVTLERLKKRGIAA